MVTEIDEYTTANGFLNQFKNINSNTDQFFQNGEVLLLGALIIFVREVYPKEDQTFKKIAGILQSQEIKDEELCKTLFKRNKVSEYAEEQWRRFMGYESKARNGIIAGLAIKLPILNF